MLERFKASTSAQQIMAVLLAAAVMGGLLAAIWFYFLRTAYEPLFTGLRATDAATIIAELDRREVPYQLGNGGTSVLVPAVQADATRLTIMSEDLPLKGTVGFELFNKSDMGLTDFAQKINYQRALQGELARTIMTLDGVGAARVHLSLGEDRVFRDDRVPPKASATIRMENGEPVPPSTVMGVQRLVAAAVPQLEVANVVVLDEAGEVVSAAPMSQATAPPTSPLMQEKRAIEQYYEARIRQALDSAYPDGSIAVTVWASLAVDGGRTGERAALPEWSPNKRDFRLQVTLAPSPTLAREAWQDVRTLAGSAIGYDAALGDVLAFGTAQEMPSIAGEGAAAQRRPARRAVIPTLPSPGELGQGWIMPTALAILALAVLAGLGITISRRKHRQGLSAGERAAFAQRLQRSLAEEDGHAASQA